MPKTPKESATSTGSASSSPNGKKTGIPGYPYYPYSRALELAAAVNRSGGHRVAVSKDQLAHEMHQAADSAVVAQLIASAKTFGMISGWGEYKLTELAKRYFFPTDDNQKRDAELMFFYHPAAFRFLIDRYDGNVLPGTSSLSNLLFKECNVPESWKERAVAIFMSTATHLKLIDPGNHLRYSVALKRSPDEAEDELASEDGIDDPPQKIAAPKVSKPTKNEEIESSSPELNVWQFTEAGATVKLLTPNPLPRLLWMRLSRYVQVLEPIDSENGG